MGLGTHVAVVVGVGVVGVGVGCVGVLTGAVLVLVGVGVLVGVVFVGDGVGVAARFCPLWIICCVAIGRFGLPLR
jgi:hypothetical protein